MICWRKLSLCSKFPHVLRCIYISSYVDWCGTQYTHMLNPSSYEPLYGLNQHSFALPLTQNYSASYLKWTFCFCSTVTDDEMMYFAWLQGIIQPLYNVFSTSESTSFQRSPSPYRASIWNKYSAVHNLQLTGVSTTHAYFYSLVHDSPDCHFEAQKSYISISASHTTCSQNRNNLGLESVLWKTVFLIWVAITYAEKGRQYFKNNTLSQEMMPESEPDNVCI